MRVPLFSNQESIEQKWARRSGVRRKQANQIWNENEIVARREKWEEDLSGYNTMKCWKWEEKVSQLLNMRNNFQSKSTVAVKINFKTLVLV